MSREPTEETLARAQQVQAEAAACGFDWPEIEGVLAKVDEEVAEIRAALAAGDRTAAAEELGDLLLVSAHLARWLDADAQAVLGGALARFEVRWQMVQRLAEERGLDVKGCALATLDALWDDAKTLTRQGPRQGG